MTSFIFGSTHRREFVFEEGDTVMATLAPSPYLSGAVGGPSVLAEFPFRFMPPLEEAEKMDFQERTLSGFKMALKDGIQVFYGLGMVLVKFGEKFSQQSGGATGLDKKILLHPKVFTRLMKGFIKSKLKRRPLLPKDLWNVKAISAGGTDMDIFRDVIHRYWGKYPVELYGSTEAGAISVQTWGEGLTFLPDSGFWEFIPEDEHMKSLDDPDYEPRTVLTDELEQGEIYEFVLTNFHGGVFVRYRQGDLIRIISLREEEHNIDIPQMVFHSRADNIIDLGSMARLTERTIAWALVEAGVEYQDWIAMKKIEGERPYLHLLIELKREDSGTEREIASRLHESLRKIDSEYQNWDEMMDGAKPAVQLLTSGTFARYAEEKQAAGAELAQLKPARMKPSEENIADLKRLGLPRKT